MEDRKSTKTYFKYWGKASREDSSYHLLPYHCLDVAAVASTWWNQSQSIRNQFVAESGVSEALTRSLVLFFVALHDLGKFDIRFQLKAEKALSQCWPEITEDDVEKDFRFYHGPQGYFVFKKQIQKHLGFHFDSISPWLKAVCGHHGDMTFHGSWEEPDAVKEIIEQDESARYDWIDWLVNHFLEPQGIKLEDELPTCPQLLAGFCSVCDWIGSNLFFFNYRSQPENLEGYWKYAQEKALSLIGEMGLQSTLTGYSGMEGIFPKYQPRQLQTLVNQLPVEPGLTIIEAPTGSGKTEVALAYASQLLNAGLADSIIFALPTQATANAMLNRLEEVANKLYQQSANIVLSHGKARFNMDFERIKQAAKKPDVQTNKEEQAAQTQCAQWLGESRKRVFLGQIGVCTIDQVLISVLPVRHNFVRQFGINKSVLIIDEVHAYDAYMYGLLISVLARQYASGGSAILLSATLPNHQKSELIQTYQQPGAFELEENTYPLISHVNANGGNRYYSPDVYHRPPERKIEIALVENSQVLPDEAMIIRIIEAAQQGALIGVVCNLVADAQKLYGQIVRCCHEKGNEFAVDLFHARYCFEHRQQHELAAISNYGKKAGRHQGRVLVATQVIEQSLDLDFDWMITQICPVDLLFQRLGRLHRHQRDNRPEDFRQPQAVVIVPENNDFGSHEYVYKTSRYLWRTRELLKQREIRFPVAYREWIEKVYEQEDWPDEPDTVIQSYDKHWIEAITALNQAKSLANTDYKPFSDTEDHVALMTRDGDMNLNVLLMQDVPEAKLLDGRLMDQLEEWEYYEAIQMNTVSVPKSWERNLPNEDKDGLIKLTLQQDGADWHWSLSKTTLTYNKTTGLERKDHEPANG